MFVLLEWAEGNRWAAWIAEGDNVKLFFIGYHFETTEKNAVAIHNDLQNDFLKLQKRIRDGS